ncbi:hypothetical protein LIX60_26870 [Streptomyces sp. S07_1.15]|uniref:hypothetical protein n=1 Tax=Streptomyces sp. S07_1.15 TaxID=2873925 RepID=UPI001D13BFCF|nr:hypothetical protein [Streptomyces sp. S07_1.15]MCC3655027.1 hypothetical protein [Streptomyces sp. S07_1.15]
MTVTTRTFLAAATALAAMATLAGTAQAAPAATGAPSAAAARCPVTAWGHQGYYKCGTDLKAGYVDWNEDGRTDEVFVIAPNRTIWHTWKNAGGWREMPGNGRADNMLGHNGTGDRRRCIVVYVNNADYHYWQNCHYNGRWHKWTTSG